jgi:WD40 repeat protein
MTADPARGGTAVVVSATDDGRILRQFHVPEWDGRVWRTGFLDDRRMVVWSWATDTVQIWDGVVGAWLKTLPGTNKVYNVRTTADGRRVIGLSTDTVTVWDADTGQKLFAIPNKPAEWSANDLILRPDGKQLAAAGTRGQLRVWTLTGD